MTTHTLEITAAAERITGQCTCLEDYSKRDMTDPQCIRCNYHADICDELQAERDRAFDDAITAIWDEQAHAEPRQKNVRDFIQVINNLKSKPAGEMG